VAKAKAICRYLELCESPVIGFSTAGPKEFVGTDPLSHHFQDHGERSQIFDGFKGENETCPKQRGDLEIARRNGDSGVHG